MPITSNINDIISQIEPNISAIGLCSNVAMFFVNTPCCEAFGIGAYCCCGYTGGCGAFSGAPQCGQLDARSETDCPQSGHVVNRDDAAGADGGGTGGFGARLFPAPSFAGYTMKSLEQRRQVIDFPV